MYFGIISFNIKLPAMIIFNQYSFSLFEFYCLIYEYRIKKKIVHTNEKYRTLMGIHYFAMCNFDKFNNLFSKLIHVFDKCNKLILDICVINFRLFKLNMYKYTYIYLYENDT